MKKSMVCGLMMSVSMFSIAAYADNDDNALTTKKYVNDGLEFVYKVANGVYDGTVKTLQNTVGTATVGNTPGTGLVGNVETLQSAVGTAGVGGAAGTGLTGAVETLQSTVGDATTGLVKRVADLESSNGYTAGTGVVVTPGASGAPSTIGVAVPSNATNGAKYVFQSDGNGGGTWTQMEVVNTWDSSFLTNP
jgi:hypothetical protein